MRNLTTRVFDSVFDMLPDEENPSPMVRIHRMHPLAPHPIPGTPAASHAPAPNSDFALYAKLEWMNPFGSVKDRAAWALIADLERKGDLRPASGDDPGRGIVEPTSGNTGISLAAIARARGYRMRAIVPNKVPLEKKIMLKLAGADLDVVNDALCPSPGMGEGSINLAKSYARAHSAKYVMPNQYENRANVDAHIKTTGPELWKQSEGRITHLFTSLGTCGTVTGTATYLKAKNRNIKVIAIQPSEGHDVPGLRNKAELPSSNLFDPSLVDEIIEVDYNLAYTTAMEICQNEGLFAGPSSGLIFAGASEYLKRERPAAGFGVTIFCDNAFKYMSNMLKHLPQLAPEALG
jgi:cysteine synthase